MKITSILKCNWPIGSAISQEVLDWININFGLKMLYNGQAYHTAIEYRAKIISWSEITSTENYLYPISSQMSLNLAGLECE